jgi:glycosyltransferase involved in cell wall biosynthesis
MNILIVPPNDLLRHPIPNRLYHIAKRLAQRHTIYLLSYPGHPLAKQKTRELKAIEITYPAKKVENLGLYYIANYPQIRAAIEKTLKTEHIDAVIHANILPSRAAADLAQKYRIPAIYDYLDHYPESAAAYYTGILKTVAEKGVWALIQKPLKKSTAITTPSYGLKAVVQAAAPDKPVYVIPNGVDPIFRPMDKQQARKAIGLDHTGPAALLYGSLDAWVDIAEVLHAVKNIRNTGIDIKLIIVGFSHAKTHYQKLLAHIKQQGLDKAVVTYPPQPYEKMPLYINSADVVISPYRKTTKNFATPLKIIESLACGKPVVAPQIIEYKIWFKQGIFTYGTISVEDAITLALNLSQDKDALIKLSDKIMQRHSWDNIAENFNYIIKLHNNNY